MNRPFTNFNRFNPNSNINNPQQFLSRRQRRYVANNRRLNFLIPGARRVAPLNFNGSFLNRSRSFNFNNRPQNYNGLPSFNNSVNMNAFNRSFNDSRGPFNRTFNRPVNNYQNGGLVAPSVARSTTSSVPYASGFSLTNTGERNISFSKEYIAAFVTIAPQPDRFSASYVTTHPSANPTTSAVCKLYSRYKILSYNFKYKASCATNSAGLHYTGVDYGIQDNIPATYQEAQSLEHFSVGPIWKDSQEWHTLKTGNTMERWFNCQTNSADPESRPARIVFGSIGVPYPRNSTGEVSLGVIEVKVNYLFSGLSQNFTGAPPQKISTTPPEEDSESIVEIVNE